LFLYYLVLFCSDAYSDPWENHDLYFKQKQNVMLSLLWFKYIRLFLVRKSHTRLIHAEINFLCTL